MRADLLEVGIGEPDTFWSVAPGVLAPETVDAAEARASLDLAEEALVITMIGRLTQIKRVDRGLAVLRELRRRGIEATLLIAGGGDLDEQLRADAADLGDAVRFLGWVGDVGTVLSAADLILLTSDNEGMPVGLIEAALAGTPAVATDVGSVGEVVLDGESGRVVSTDVGDLADACAELLAAPDTRAEMSAAATRHASAAFGADGLVSRHHEIYRNMLGN